MTIPYATINEAIGGVAATGLLAASLGYLYAQFGAGRRQEASDKLTANTQLIENMQVQINSQKEAMADLQAQLKVLSDANIALTATNAALEKTNAGYLSLFQGTNPTSIQALMAKLDHTMTEIHALLVANTPAGQTINIQK